MTGRFDHRSPGPEESLIDPPNSFLRRAQTQEHFARGRAGLVSEHRALGLRLIEDLATRENWNARNLVSELQRVARLNPDASFGELLSRVDGEIADPSRIDALLSDFVFQKFLTITQEVDPEVRVAQWEFFAREDLLPAGMFSSCQTILEILQRHPEQVRHASGLQHVLEGKSVLGDHFESALTHLHRESTHVSSLGGMSAATLLAPAAELAALKLFRALIKTDKFAGLAARTVGIGMESFAFSSVRRITSEWEGQSSLNQQSYFSDVFAGFLLFGARALSQRAVQAARSALLTHSASIAGIAGSSKFAELMGLQPAGQRGTGDYLWDATLTHLQGLVGTRIAHRLSGGRLQNVASDLRLRLKHFVSSQKSLALAGQTGFARAARDGAAPAEAVFSNKKLTRWNNPTWNSALSLGLPSAGAFLDGIPMSATLAALAAGMFLSVWRSSGTSSITSEDADVIVKNIEAKRSEKNPEMYQWLGLLQDLEASGVNLSQKSAEYLDQFWKTATHEDVELLRKAFEIAWNQDGKVSRLLRYFELIRRNSENPEVRRLAKREAAKATIDMNRTIALRRHAYRGLGPEELMEKLDDALLQGDRLAINEHFEYLAEHLDQDLEMLWNNLLRQHEHAQVRLNYYSFLFDPNRARSQKRRQKKSAQQIWSMDEAARIQADLHSGNILRQNSAVEIAELFTAFGVKDAARFWIPEQSDIRNLPKRSKSGGKS